MSGVMGVFGLSGAGRGGRVRGEIAEAEERLRLNDSLFTWALPEAEVGALD